MSDLIDRYVGATLRSIPEKQRADIEAELRASIGDAVEARVEGGEAADTATTAVLTELGDPDRLAAGYSGKPSYLIGPQHFFDYKRLLTVLVVTVAPIVMAVIASIELIGGEDIGSVIGRAISMGLTLVVHIGFWTTLAFYLVEQSGESIGSKWSLSDLPDRAAAGSIKLGDTIASVASVAIGIALLIVSRTNSPMTAADGSPIFIFDDAAWDFWIPFLIAVLVVEIIFEVVKYARRHWTWGLASVQLAVSALFTIPAVFLILTDRLFSPAFVERLADTGVSVDWAKQTLAVVVVVIALIEVVNGFYKASRGR